MLLRTGAHVVWPPPAWTPHRTSTVQARRVCGSDAYLRTYVRSFAIPLAAIAVALGATLLLAASLLPAG